MAAVADNRCGCLILLAHRRFHGPGCGGAGVERQGTELP